MQRRLIASETVQTVIAVAVGARTLRLSEHVDQHRGTVWVEGVVATAAEKDGARALINRYEFKKCRMTTCARLYLPV